MDTTRRWSGAGVSSGSEVESARFHPVTADPLLPPYDSRFETPHVGRLSEVRSKIEDWKSSGMAAVNDMRQTIRSRSARLKSTAAEQASRIKPMVRDLGGRAQHDIKANPAKWAGVAAGAGMVLGGLSRYLRYRARVRTAPRVVVIQASC